MGIANIIIVFILIQTTNLGIYAVAGVSSVLTLGRILIFVPIYATHSIKVSYVTFYKPLLRGIISSGVMLLAFIVIHKVSIINSWISFFAICGISAILGYIIVFMIVFSKDEKTKVISIIKSRIGR